MLEAIKKHLLPLGVQLGETDFGEERLFGGYFIWLKLPDGVDTDVVTKEGADKWNLILSPGSVFEVSGDNMNEKVRFRNEMRLSFAWIEENELVEGVKRLKDVIASVVNGR